MTDHVYDVTSFEDNDESARRTELLRLMRECPIPDDEMLNNVGLFLTPQNLSRVLFMDFLYRQIINVQGVICEFGCRWGQNVALFSSLRGIYEPFNRLRKMVAFDTFEGFPNVCEKDGDKMKPGGYSVCPGYEEYLGQVIKLQEEESPLPHIVKHEIVKGDASKTIHKYLDENPETIIALAYFDMDLYEPTKECLKAIKGHITQGTIIGFDEANEHALPGETIALKEVLGTENYSLRRFPQCARTSYLVFE